MALDIRAVCLITVAFGDVDLAIGNMPMDWIQDFTPNKPRIVIFTSGDDAEAKQQVIELINSTGLVAIDLGSLSKGGVMHEVGAPLSGLELHFVRRLR